MELKHAHMLVLYLLYKGHHELIAEDYRYELNELIDAGYAEPSPDWKLTGKGQMAIAFATKKAGEI